MAVAELAREKTGVVMPLSRDAVRLIANLKELPEEEEDRMWNSAGSPVSKEAAKRLFS